MMFTTIGACLTSGALRWRRKRLLALGIVSRFFTFPARFKDGVGLLPNDTMTTSTRGIFPRPGKN